MGGAAVGSATPVQGAFGPISPAQASPVGPAGPRRRGRTVALVAALVVLVGGGGVFGLHQWNSGSKKAGSAVSASPSATPSGSPSATASASAQPSAVPGTVPKDWVRVEDPAGFSLSLPQGWTRTETNGQIDYSPDGGEHFLRIAIDESPDFDDPYLHQLDLEQQLQKLSEYKRVSLESNVYRDRKGSLWDFTWTALAKDGGSRGRGGPSSRRISAATAPSTCSTCPLRRPTGRLRASSSRRCCGAGARTPADTAAHTARLVGRLSVIRRSAPRSPALRCGMMRRMGTEGDSFRVIAGRYRLEARLGRGGMGVVWRATDQLLERRVAVKELTQDTSSRRTRPGCAATAPCARRARSPSCTTRTSSSSTMSSRTTNARTSSWS